MRLRTVILGAVLVAFIVITHQLVYAADIATTMSEEQIAMAQKYELLPKGDPHCADKIPENARAFAVTMGKSGAFFFGESATNETVECWVTSPRSHLTLTERQLWLALWRQHQYAKTTTQLLETSLETTRQLVRGQEIIRRNGQYWRCVPIDPN